MESDNRRDDEIILFGCGKIGHEALEFLGSENIECFCDNNQALSGTRRGDKVIISFDELKQKYGNAVVIICILDDFSAYAIAEQCEENGVLDYLFFSSVKEISAERTETLNYIKSASNRADMRRKILNTRIKKLLAQVNYFKTHADIRHMKPAGGTLRKRQLDTIHVAAEFFERTAELGIKPILYSGNLLGYIRHNGFIPWDDDLDFALIRDEYEKLKEYCKLNVNTPQEFLKKCNEHKSDETVKRDLEDFSWIYYGTHIQIHKRITEDGGTVSFDFFPLDYYEDNYSFDELMEFAAEVQGDFLSAGSMEKKIGCLGNAWMKNKENLAERSKKIYFGIDNMDIWQRYHKGWIPEKAVFPLRKVLYEGEYFWIPNDPEKFVEYEYEDIWGFPDDIGIPKHLGMADD